MPKPLVIDNFNSHWHAWRPAIFERPFHDVELDGLTYNNISIDTRWEVFERLKERAGFEAIEPIACFFRAYMDDGKPEATFVHSDQSICKYIAVLFVSQSKAQELEDNNGLQLWRHSWTNKHESPDPRRFRQTYNYDPISIEGMFDSESRNEKAWRKEHFVKFKENRLVVFPASWFHSKWPRQNTGKRLRSARIVQVMFFNGREPKDGLFVE
jgi:hypothetical protein